MIHARVDYNRIQDPALHDPSLLAEGTSPFAGDEPVFILRAKDVTAPETLRHRPTFPAKPSDPLLARVVCEDRPCAVGKRSASY